jgi:hypothetical protein
MRNRGNKRIISLRNSDFFCREICACMVRMPAPNMNEADHSESAVFGAAVNCARSPGASLVPRESVRRQVDQRETAFVKPSSFNVCVCKALCGLFIGAVHASSRLAVCFVRFSSAPPIARGRTGYSVGGCARVVRRICFLPWAAGPDLLLGNSGRDATFGRLDLF